MQSYKKIAAIIYNNSEPIGYADLHVNHRTEGVTYLGLLLLKKNEQEIRKVIPGLKIKAS